MSELNEELPAVEATEAAVIVPPLPGRTLREAREARHLTVFEVAQSLKFSPRQVEAIEADDFGALPPGATFVRGFVRGYAKLLKLDPAPLLVMLDAQAPSVLPDVRAPQNMGVAASPIAAGRRSSTPMLWGSGVLAILGAGLAAWHFLGEPITEGKKSSPVEAVAENAATSVRPPEVRVEAAPAALPAATGDVAPAAPQAPASPDMRQLIFVFQDKSWVEVRDANQRVLLSGENPAGTRQAVSGRPPFQLVVGNAAKVEVQYEDRQVDLKPYIRAEVARLTIE